MTIYNNILDCLPSCASCDNGNSCKSCSNEGTLPENLCSCNSPNEDGSN